MIKNALYNSGTHSYEEQLVTPYETKSGIKPSQTCYKYSAWDRRLQSQQRIGANTIHDELPDGRGVGQPTTLEDD
jgi:hypothetical protein